VLGTGRPVMAGRPKGYLIQRLVRTGPTETQEHVT
jgi:hypothetical protein